MSNTLFQIFFIAQLFVLLPPAQAQLFSCRSSKLENYKTICQKENSCVIAEEFNSYSPRNWTKLFKKNRCLEGRAQSCFCLTYLGARYFRQIDFDWDTFKIHGHYCGWRSGHRGPSGEPLNWKDKAAVRTADLSRPGNDALDEVCRVHDVEYDVPNIDFCKADQRAIRAMVSLALDTTNEFSMSMRERSLVMARSLHMNRHACHLLNWLR